MDRLTWPDAWLNKAEFRRQWRAIRPAFLARLLEHRMPESQAEPLAAVYLPLAAWVLTQPRLGPYVLGINGAQGSGKTTLCDFLTLILARLHGQRVASLSIDDFYRTRAERQQLARVVHPLLITRGVPGTHDVALALTTLRNLKTASSSTLTALPSFDKALDDRRPERDWPQFQGRPDIILFEGWCVGARPQPEAALAEPVNDLERNEDPDGVWRHYVNAQLMGDYAGLFAELDGLVLLRVPNMASVFEWRRLQEQKLAQTATARGHRLMNDEAIRRFIGHYERLTRHNIEEIPEWANLVFHINTHHAFSRVEVKTPPALKRPVSS